MAVVAGRSTRSLDRMKISYRIAFIAIVAGGCALPPEPLPVEPFPNLSLGGKSCAKLPPILIRTEPRFPLSAAKSGQAGWVILEYDILANGNTSNVAVVASSPRGVFDAATVAAVREWKFEANAPVQRCRLDMKVRME